MLPDYERLGVFYLGKGKDGPYLYDSKDLTTHAVVIGMTGSGKTGLSIGLLEEAAIDGIPAIVVDPKGDLSNLLLAFPDLAPEDFAPWAPEGKTAKDEATTWKEGLGAWNEDGARVRRFKEAADFTVYTPGSRAGVPVSLLAELRAPAPDQRDDVEAMKERVAAVTQSLLGLVEVGGDARSREHVLLATILTRAWEKGDDLDLPSLVAKVQDPGFSTAGVLPLETFFPKKDRLALALSLNALLAAPGFESWLEGVPLDVGSFLFTKEGKPRVSIFSIAHLADPERMFFVTLLLGQIVSWMRTQRGTSSLRALFYMDEIAGYFPPVATPPSKAPLLLLLKQARAFGLGVVLATQNPVDLDYKGLSNCGTWFVGRLQTERDKARVTEGLEGVLASHGVEKGELERLLSSLEPRHFLVHDVHRPKPEVIQTRWTLSYLRGPMTREDVKTLMDAKGRPAIDAARIEDRAPTKPATPLSTLPAIPEGVRCLFFPSEASGSGVAYEPYLLGAADVHFVDPRTGLDLIRSVVFVTPAAEGSLSLATPWEGAKWSHLPLTELEDTPIEGSTFGETSTALGSKKNWSAWQKAFSTWLHKNQGVSRLRSAELGAVSNPGENEAAFRGRIALSLREAKDARAAKLRAKYAPKFEALASKLATARSAVERETAEATAMDQSGTASSGAAFFGAFFGRGSVVQASAKAVKNSARSKKASADVAREKAKVQMLETKWRELDAELGRELALDAEKFDARGTVLESVVVKPKKTGIEVTLVALAFRIKGN